MILTTSERIETRPPIIVLLVWSDFRKKSKFLKLNMESDYN